MKQELKAALIDGLGLAIGIAGLVALLLACGWGK